MRINSTRIYDKNLILQRKRKHLNENTLLLIILIVGSMVIHRKHPGAGWCDSDDNIANFETD